MPLRSETAPVTATPGAPDWRVRVARAWFWLGLAAIVVWPAAREQQRLIGWLPFWLLLAPLALLAQLEAHRWLAWFRAAPSRARRALHRRPRRQAQRRARARPHALVALRR
jgi:hypothetical protein